MSRKKVFIKSAILGYINMFIVMLVGIVSQPMLLKQLGISEFGIWILTLNILTYIGNSNVGIPGAALVYISKSKNSEIKKDIVKKSFILLLIISVIVAGIFTLIIKTIPQWYLFMGDFDSQFYSVIKYTITISIILLLIRLPLQLAQSAFSGYQDIHINKFYETINAIVPFLALVLIVILDKQIIALAIFTGIGYIIVNFMATIHLVLKYKYFKKDVKGKSTYIKDFIKYSDLLKSGWGFFILGIGSVLIYNTDNLVISNFVGADKIPSYNFAFKLYQMAVQIMNIFTGISMPLYGNALVNNDYKWLKSIYTNMTTIFPIFAGAIWIGGMLIGRDILDIWSRDKNIFGGYALLFILGAFTYSLSIVNINSTFLSGIDSKKESVRLIWVEAILNLVLSIILGKFIGISGVALGTLLSSICVPLLFLPKYVKKYTHNKVRFNYSQFLKHFFIAVLPILTISTLIRNIMYNQTIYIKVIITIIIMFVYLIISYILIPKHIKEKYNNIILKN